MSFHHRNAIMVDVVKVDKIRRGLDELNMWIALITRVITEILISSGQGLICTRWKGWLFIS